MPAQPAVAVEVAVGGDGLDLLALHQQDPVRFPVLLETAAPALGSTAQYDWLLIADPSAEAGGFAFRVSEEEAVAGKLPGGRILAAVDAAIQEAAREHGEVAKGAYPFVGGFFFYGAYELAAEVEPVLRLPLRAGDLVACLLPIAGAVVRHQETGRVEVVSLPRHAALAAAVAQQVASFRLSATPPSPAVAVVGGLAHDPSASVQREVSEDEPVRFTAAVESALAAIAAGDVYQANLSRAWQTRLLPGESPVDLYRRLRRANPGPFAGLASLPGLTVLSTSPERLVRVAGRAVDTRPIAGTRPRQPGDAAADAALAAELRAHPKEQAEHVMLVDLERNDLGRLCRAGTVVVDEFMVLEQYAHVHHIVSNVSGELRAGVTPGQVLRALFPGGTITGCPKVRCMQLIGELEREPRGAYTGSMGWIGLDGDLDLNILIRTAEVRPDGRVRLRAGAGIVADSVPALELAETRAKARGLLRGLGVATA